MLPMSQQGEFFDEGCRSSDGLAATQFEAQMKRIWQVFGVAQDVDLARAFGKGQTTVSNARTKKSIPAKWLKELNSKHGISINWILSGTGPMKVGQPGESYPSGQTAPTSGAAPATLDSEQFLMIPLLESRVTGGLEGELLYDDIADYLPFKRDWIERLVGRNPDRQRALILVRVRGDSMSPTINQGEVTLVDTFEYERLQVLNGRIYLVIHPDGTVAMKRLVLIQEADRVKLLCLSDNTPDYRPFEFDLEPNKTLKHYILGRVRWCGKEFE